MFNCVNKILSSHFQLHISIRMVLLNSKMINKSLFWRLELLQLKYCYIDILNFYIYPVCNVQVLLKCILS